MRFIAPFPICNNMHILLTWNHQFCDAMPIPGLRKVFKVHPNSYQTQGFSIYGVAHFPEIMHSHLPLYTTHDYPTSVVIARGNVQLEKMHTYAIMADRCGESVGDLAVCNWEWAIMRRAWTHVAADCYSKKGLRIKSWGSKDSASLTNVTYRSK